MRRLIDHVLCTLPFEHEWFSAQGCNATLVGHPFFDEVRRHRLDREFIDRLRGDAKEAGWFERPPYRPLVTILPGSRRQELTNNLRWLLKAAQRIRHAVPDVRFAVAALKEEHAEMVARDAAKLDLPLEIHVGRTPELIHAADCCLTKSGSVSLELLYHCKPTVVLYRISRRAYWLASWLVKVKYMTLVNLLVASDPFAESRAPWDPSKPGAEEVLFPEYPTYQDKSAELAGHVIDWLTNAGQREELVARLAELKARVCHPGAADRAAQYVLSALQPASPPTEKAPRLLRSSRGAGSAMG
jgi:lipid-A-disaccharide synthase